MKPTQTEENRVIAVIGTGNMGAPMAVNLCHAGFTVNAYDLLEEKLEPLREHGVLACKNHAEAIANASVVLTMLPTGKEVDEVTREHFLVHARPGTLLIDSSTIDLETAKILHALLSAKGFPTLDAPVSGGTMGAHAGKLTFMVGGSAELLELARPVFEAMAAKIIHCGSGGMGQAAKMCNNMMLGIQMASVAEGFRLAQNVGLSEKTLYDVSANSSGNCFSLTAFNPIPGLLPETPASRGYQPGFSTDLMLKDMKLALAAAEASSVALDVAPVALELYRSFSEAGNGGLDFSAIFNLHDGEK